jgi:hypothetical protein
MDAPRVVILFTVLDRQAPDRRRLYTHNSPHLLMNTERRLYSIKVELHQAYVGRESDRGPQFWCKTLGLRRNLTYALVSRCASQ